MKFIKENWTYILIFILFFILSRFFPITGSDYSWANIANNLDIKNFYSTSNGKLLYTSLLLLFTKYKILRMLTYGVISTSLFVLMKNIVNKKNNTLLYISIFLFLLLGTNYLSGGYVFASGFVNNIIGTVFIFLYLNLFIKNQVNKIGELPLFLLGVASALINPYLSIILIILTIIEIFMRKSKYLSTKYYGMLVFGLMVGTSLMVYQLLKSNILIFTPKFTDNLFYNLIPELYGCNFLILLIFIAFLSFLCIKIFLRESLVKRIYVGISMIIIFGFALVYILGANHILRYIFFVLFTWVSIFILLNGNNSLAFKKRITMYYIFQITYIFIIMFKSDIVAYDLMFPYLIYILIILELVNYIFPNNFLETIWFGIVIILLGVNIYTYKSVFQKHEKMNYYIKNHLECDIYDFSIPSKFNTDYLYSILPSGYDEQINYIEYFGIETNYLFNIYFNE